ncbi:MAG: hypothetical protein HFI70_07290 [Lachnospiraceae bacterium]|nr:hypothetical protein [Lachnospiraceae bacterium]
MIENNHKTEEIPKSLRGKKKEIKWDKLDNTAHIFPVIAGESMSNVYRISVTLEEEIQQELLQEALNRILPWFEVFRVRIRYGVFWYYFETNQKPAPEVKQEYRYPCQFISPNRNHNYLFRVNYYKNRINLEVFHVLTDGMGGITFLRELTYQYLRLSHPELQEKLGDGLCSDTSLNREDSYLKNYKRSHKKGYKTERAFHVKGEKLDPTELGIMHGYMSVSVLKKVCAEYQVSINEYLVAAFLWSIYQECMHGMPGKHPVSSCVPVNLRPYFDSITMKNFFVIVSAVFHPRKESYTFAEVVEIVAESLRSQINREHLENLFAYNVSNEKNFILRAVPLFIKNIAIRYVYHNSALANTTTVTNIGNIQVREEYQRYIKHFSSFLSMSEGQNIKGTICSYKDTLVFTISSNLSDTSVQRGFFRRLSEDGIPVQIETNGVYGE